MFFHAASDQCAKRSTSKKHRKNQYETHFGASAHRPTIDQKSIRKRFRLRLATRTALRASWELSRRLLERLWGGPGTLLDGSWLLLARPGRPKIGLGAALGHPKIVSSASGRLSETALSARTGPRSIFHRFLEDVGFMFVVFRSRRLRRSLKIRISKRSRAILTARLGACVVQSLRTACTSFEMACEHYMLSLFSLRTHKCT